VGLEREKFLELLGGGGLGVGIDGLCLMLQESVRDSTVETRRAQAGGHAAKEL